jgi:hypothetical protein
MNSSGQALKHVAWIQKRVDREEKSHQHNYQCYQSK